MKLPKPILLLFLLTSANFLTAGNIYAVEHLLISSANIVQIDSLTSDSLQVNADSTVLDSTSSKKSPLDSKVSYSARDSIRFDIQGKEAYLYGDAQVFYENISLKAEYIRIDQANYTVYAEGVADSTGKIIGKPVFKEGDQEYRSDQMAYNFKTKKGSIKEVKTNEGDGYLQGQVVRKTETDELYIKNGRYSTCNLDHPHFYIAITKSKVTKKRIVTGPAYLVIEDVPLPVAVPFGFFPKKDRRASGILLPEIGEDNALGFFLRGGGYYLGISDNVDQEIRGNIFSKGSYGLSSRTNYYNRYHYRGDLFLNYSERRIGEPGTVEFKLDRDALIKWTHTQDGKARPGSSFNANVNAGTSSFLKNNSYDVNDITRNTLSSSITYTKTWLNTPFSMTTGIVHSQNLQAKTVNLGVPSISLSMGRINPLDSKKRIGKQVWYQKIGVGYRLSAENSISTYDSLLFRPESLKDFRNGIMQSVPISTSLKVFKYLNITPEATYTERWNFSTINRNAFGTDTIYGLKTARDYRLSTSASTMLYGMYNINKLGIKAIRHVISPSISYTYRPDYTEPGYGYYKMYIDTLGKLKQYSIFENSIYGSPPVGKFGSIGFSLRNSLEMKVRTNNDTTDEFKKVKLLENISVSGSYNTAVKVFNWSNINISALNTFFERITANLSLGYDPYALENGERINTLLASQGNYWGRLSNASFSLSGNLNSAANPKGGSSLFGYGGLDYYDMNMPSYVDFNIPWSLYISYSYTYNKPLLIASEMKSLNFNGDVKLTPKWKVGFNSGYDFQTKEITYTSLNINRDLHCWDLKIRWTPFGTYQSYSVDLRVKASILQDLKLSRRREYYDKVN